MKSHLALIVSIGLASLLFANSACAATSFTNSLLGFTGNSTVAGTQTAVSAAGFNFFSITGLNDPDFTADPTVAFAANGATFGSLWGGDGGRNYMRTNDSDYATVSFVAELTFETTNLASQDAFIGLGSGDTALFGWPDWSTQFSSVIFTPEITDAGVSTLTTMYTNNDTPIFANKVSSNLLSGINRIRMAFDATTKIVDFSMDYNYAGGAFVQDDFAAPIDLSTLFSPPGQSYDAAAYTVWRDTLGSTTDLRANWDTSTGNLIDQADYDFWKLHFGESLPGTGWPSEPSRIYFGGDDGVVFSDFSVVVSGPAAATAVPEPASVLVAVGALLGLAACYRKR